VEPIPIVYDTDGGVDDCTALWYALHEPALDLVAVTTVRGVVSAAQAARNVCKVLHAAGRRDIPVAVGAEERFGPAPDLPGTEHIHGRDGLGDAGIPEAPFGPGQEGAVALLGRLVSERPGELTLVAVGPFTNVACALRDVSGLPAVLRGLVVMGGVAVPPGNTLPMGEFNAVFDPSATAAMVEAAWPSPPLMVGLDATLQATLGDDEHALVGEGRTPAARFMHAPLAFYRAFRASLSERGEAPSHDTLAVMAVAHPDVVHAEELPLRVDTGGSAAWGATVVDLRARALPGMPPERAEPLRRAWFAGAPVWRVALGADVAAFRRHLLPLLGG
jgi:purine nucleosidase